MDSKNAFCGICLFVFKKEGAFFFFFPPLNDSCCHNDVLWQSFFCNACPFLVPPLKAKGATASSMVKGAPAESEYKYMRTSWLLLGGDCMARAVKETESKGYTTGLKYLKAQTAQLSCQCLKMYYACSVTYEKQYLCIVNHDVSRVPC